MFSILEAVINVVVSVILVWFYGLIGVAIGTLAAVLFRLIYLVVYLTKNILNRNIIQFMKIVAIDLIYLACAIITVYFLRGIFNWNCVSYAQWIVLALEITGICLGEALFVYGIFSFKKTQKVFAQIKRRFFRKGVENETDKEDNTKNN